MKRANKKESVKKVVIGYCVFRIPYEEFWPRRYKVTFTKKECKELGNTHTNVQWFHQGANKESRIFSNSASVMANVYYPENWIDKFPEFAEAMMRYQREGKNLHDDAPDCITGVYENPKPLGGWMY